MRTLDYFNSFAIYLCCDIYLLKLGRKRQRKPAKVLEVKFAKRKCTSAVYVKKWRQKQSSIDPNFKHLESKRVEAIRKQRFMAMSITERNKYRKAAAERQCKSRAFKIAANQKLSDSVSTFTCAYKTPQALGKALKKVNVALPLSPSKRRKVLSVLTEHAGLKITTEKCSSTKSSQALHPDVIQRVSDFYNDPSIVFICPGMNDVMALWNENGQKEKKTKMYLQMFIKEAYYMYKQKYPDDKIGLTKFTELRPRNVLLMSETPSDQCRCIIHDNFLLKLKSIKKQIEWNHFLCNDEMNSICWSGKCLKCGQGQLLDSYLEPSDNDTQVIWQCWEKTEIDGKRSLTKVIHEHSRSVLKNAIINDFSLYRNHVFNKRVQQQEFNDDKQKANEWILQTDFAMSYTCEYQDEIQSALWARKSILIFTAALFNQGKCFTFALCSDINTKDKNTVCALLIQLYNIIKSSHNITPTIIFTDGPASEFKNKFMVKLLAFLCCKFNVNISWKYFATGHGKGVIDGVGGRCKSLVRSLVLGRKEIVQCSADFVRVAKKIMPSTTFINITDSDIADVMDNLPHFWDTILPIPGIKSKHVIRAMHVGDKLYVHLLNNALDKDELIIDYELRDISNMFVKVHEDISQSCGNVSPLNSFAEIEVSSERSSSKLFFAKVISQTEYTVTVQYLKLVRGTSNTYVANETDEFTEPKSSVKRFLPPPKLLNSRGHLLFD